MSSGWWLAPAGATYGAVATARERAGASASASAGAAAAAPTLWADCQLDAALASHGHKQAAPTYRVSQLSLLLLPLFDQIGSDLLTSEMRLGAPSARLCRQLTAAPPVQRSSGASLRSRPTTCWLASSQAAHSETPRRWRRNQTARPRRRSELPPSRGARRLARRPNRSGDKPQQTC